MIAPPDSREAARAVLDMRGCGVEIGTETSCSSRWPGHGESPLSAVAPGTAGARILASSGLSYCSTAH